MGRGVLKQADGRMAPRAIFETFFEGFPPSEVKPRITRSTNPRMWKRAIICYDDQSSRNNALKATTLTIPHHGEEERTDGDQSPLAGFGYCSGNNGGIKD